MASQISGRAQRRNNYGVTVERATSALAQTGTLNLFSVTGGRILLTTIVGEVTTVIQAQANAVKLELAGTAGVTSDMCATVDVNGKAVGNLFGIVGTPATAAVMGAAVPQPNEMICQPGNIRMNAAASNTGAMKWTVTYVPLDDGAVVAAV